MPTRLSLDQLLFGLCLALAASLPFEPIQAPLSLSLGRFSLNLNHLKLLLGLAVLVWLLDLVRRPETRRRLRQLWPAALLLGAVALSAALAPTNRAEAEKFVGRFASGMLMLPLVLHVVRTEARLRALVWAVGGGAAASALLGLGEATGWSVLQPVLELFKIAPTRVGGDLRLSASFQYATIAAMFFELVIPVALGLAATAAAASARLVAMAISVLSTMVLVLTVTRAGLLAVGAALLVLLLFGRRQPRWRSILRPTLLTVAAAVAGLGGLAIGQQAFATRLATENDWGWYAATYTAPASLELWSGAPTQATIVAHNAGQAVWSSSGTHPFALAYRWLSADDQQQLQLPQKQVFLTRDVSPGDSVAIVVDLQPSPGLAAGEYRLAWGMLQQDVLWFHDRGYPDAETAVRITRAAALGQPSSPVAEAPRTDTSATVAPVPRLELWRAALKVFLAYPLLGVGPDNFRHVYGSALGLDAWDQRVDANNLYLESLADTGILGVAAFGVLLVAFGRRIWRPLLETRSVWLAVLGASLLAFFVHGVFDSFLSFTSTAMLFWLIVGASMAAAQFESC